MVSGHIKYNLYTKNVCAGFLKLHDIQHSNPCKCNHSPWSPAEKLWLVLGLNWRGIALFVWDSWGNEAQDHSWTRVDWWRYEWPLRGGLRCIEAGGTWIYWRAFSLLRDILTPCQEIAIPTLHYWHRCRRKQSVLYLQSAWLLGSRRLYPKCAGNHDRRTLWIQVSDIFQKATFWMCLKGLTVTFLFYCIIP